MADCERCGREADVAQTGQAAPLLCVVCATIEGREAERRRALAGSPYVAPEPESGAEPPEAWEEWRPGLIRRALAGNSAG